MSDAWGKVTKEGSTRECTLGDRRDAVVIARFILSLVVHPRRLLGLVLLWCLVLSCTRAARHQLAMQEVLWAPAQSRGPAVAR